jgi:beta-1,4-mannosyltransferase
VQICYLIQAMCRCEKPRMLLMQNPPCIPTMAVLSVFRLVWNCDLVYDWHNYGYTILALSLGTRHPLARLSKVYEKLFAKFSDYNICVTNAMKQDLHDNWGVEATVLYDKPPARFRELTPEERTSFLQSRDFMEDTGRLTETGRNSVLVVSSTSWTPDEDFSVLLNAFIGYDKVAADCEDYPDIVCVITGKGPEKEKYLEEIKTLNLTTVSFHTPWLEADDYPRMIASADLGVCLHTSSSGLDLPMKVVDMFGCNLPVCAIQFSCISELVYDQKNGRLFGDSTELTQHFISLFRHFHSNRSLRLMRDYLRSTSHVRWDDEWESKFLPIVKRIR